MKILIAADGSQYTARVLDWLATQSGWLGAQHEYTVLHCVLAMPHRALTLGGPAVVRALYDEDADAVLEPVRAFFRQHGLAARFVYEIGMPAEHIAKLAEDGKFDLVLMGSHGVGALAGLVLGSASTRVLALCRTPVLLVR